MHPAALLWLISTAFPAARNHTPPPFLHSQVRTLQLQVEDENDTAAANRGGFQSTAGAGTPPARSRFKHTVGRATLSPVPLGV